MALHIRYRETWWHDACGPACDASLLGAQTTALVPYFGN